MLHDLLLYLQGLDILGKFLCSALGYLKIPHLRGRHIADIGHQP